METGINMNEIQGKTLNKANHGDDGVNYDPEATEMDTFTNNKDSSHGRFENSSKTEQKKMKGLSRIREELHREVFWKIKVWMALIFLFILIILLIIIFVAVCAASDEDDDSYDRSLFTIPHYFNGSFQMSNFSSSTSIASELQKKLADLYTISPALGRYFSKIELNYLRNDLMKYNVTFVLPEDKIEDLKKFMLSRDMVYNVFRQYLYDQDEKELGRLFIVPDSLEMSLIN